MHLAWAATTLLAGVCAADSVAQRSEMIFSDLPPHYVIERLQDLRGHLFLFACPKRLDDLRQFRELSICLDRETFVPTGRRTVLPDGGWKSHMVTALQVNGDEYSAPHRSAAGSAR